MGQASASAGTWSDDERQAEFNHRLWLAVASSLVLHLVVLAVAAFVRLPQHSERPLASMEVSLASLQTTPIKEVEPSKSPSKAVAPPRAKAVTPPKSPPKVAEPPPQAKVVTPPASPPKVVELPPQVAAVTPPPSPPKNVEPPPPAQPVKVAPATQSEPMKAPAHDIMKSLELPPDAPKFGDFSPPPKAAKKQFKLPDVPVVSEAQPTTSKAPDVTPQPLLSEDFNKEVEDDLQTIKKIDLPKAAPPAQPAMPKPAPQVEAKAPSVKAVDATLKISGMAPGANAYLGRVRQRISSAWTAPPVDISGHEYVVIVQFRLHRDGSVTKVEIEQSSGNEYYDLAGKRAVLSAKPLPAFPPELTEPHFDAHFTFRVGDSQG